MSLMLHRTGLLRPSIGAPAPSVPDAFEASDWGIEPSDEEADITIDALPANNGSTITDIEYRLDGGSWVSSGGTTSFTIGGLTNDQEYDVELRAVNAIGAGPASDAKQVTPAGASFHPLDLTPEILIEISDLGTLFQERTGASATVPAGVGDPVGTIANKGALGGYAVAPADSERMILRQNGSGKYYLEADGTDDRYACSWSNSAGARSSCLGVQSAGAWVMTADNGALNNSDGLVFSGTLYIGGATSRLHTANATPSTTSPGAVVSTLSGPGTTPAVWRNGSAVGTTDLTGRDWGGTIIGLFGYAGSAAAGGAHYYGYFSKFGTLSSSDRAAVEAWMAEQMGL